MVAYSCPFDFHQSLSPLHAMHRSQRFITSSMRNPLSSCSSLQWSYVICFIRDRTEVKGFVTLYIRFLSVGQRWKSAGVRSGEFGGHRQSNCFAHLPFFWYSDFFVEISLGVIRAGFCAGYVYLQSLTVPYVKYRSTMFLIVLRDGRFLPWYRKDRDRKPLLI